MKKTNYWKILITGLLKENPVFVLILGTCPTLALTTAAMNGIYMGMAVIFVLICSNVLISLLRKIIPNQVRIPAFVLIIATFVTVVRLLLDYFLPDLNDVLGLYLPLIVVNCIILARAESFASKNTVLASALDGLFTGIGFMIGLTVLGLVREILGQGAAFGLKLWSFKIEFFSSPAGAFFTYGVFIALFSFISSLIEKKRKLKLYAKLIESKQQNNTETECE